MLVILCENVFVNVRVQKSWEGLTQGRLLTVDTNKLLDYVYRQTKNEAKIVEFKYLYSMQINRLHKRYNSKQWYIIGLIPLLFLVILTNSGFGFCKIKSLDFVPVIWDSFTFGPLFKHVGKICVCACWLCNFFIFYFFLYPIAWHVLKIIKIIFISSSSSSTFQPPPLKNS